MSLYQRSPGGAAHDHLTAPVPPAAGDSSSRARQCHGSCHVGSRPESAASHRHGISFCRCLLVIRVNCRPVSVELAPCLGFKNQQLPSRARLSSAITRTKRRDRATEDGVHPRNRLKNLKWHFERPPMCGKERSHHHQSRILSAVILGTLYWQPVPK